MALHEHTLNIGLGKALDGMRRRWEVRTENLGLASDSRERPDILITEAGAAPLVIEHESAPAVNVEEEARARLGMRLREGGVVRAAIALRSAAALREARDDELAARLAAQTDFEWALFRAIGRGETERWPERGWLRGGLRDLALLAQQAMRPSEEIDILAEILERDIDAARTIFTNAHPEGDAAVAQLLAAELRLEDGPQTRRMAMAILANALIFQQSLAPQMAGVRTPEQLYEAKSLHKSAVLAAWEAILRVNYYPIFHIAQGLLRGMARVDIAQRILEQLYHIIEAIVRRGATRSHHLVGFIFQRLIADRKFLATFYTRPESAALLAALALPAGERWADAEHIRNLRVADFACGTGTLLAAVQNRLSALHELHGYASRDIHCELLEKVLLGTDVLPMAVHLSLSMLAAHHPDIVFEYCAMLTMPYGKQETGEYALGALDLLTSQRALPTIATRPEALTGSGTAAAHDVPDRHYDLVIMNPPFTRPTGQEGENIGIPNPAFAGLGTTDEDQRAMSKMLSSMRRLGVPYHGNAGLASAFVGLADKKLAEGGMLALVLPLMATSGTSWEAVRQLLRKNYADITVVTIAGAKSADKAFSADTGMGECLIIAKKCEGNGCPSATFITLRQKPRETMEGEIIAETLEKAASIRSLEDGPFGGTDIRIGEDHIGQILSYPIPESGPWQLSGILDFSVAQTAHQLVTGTLWLPGSSHRTLLPMTRLSELIAEPPVYHMTITSHWYDKRKTPHAPFDIHKPHINPSPTYPTLWANNAANERHMIVEPDSEAIVRHSDDPVIQAEIERKARRIWATRTRLHCNRNLRYNSQSLVVSIVSIPSIGGHSWPSIIFPEDIRAAWEETHAVWANSTLGILCYWWNASRQQGGRGRMTITGLPSVPTLDLRRLSPAQLAAAARIFADHKHLPMLPVNQIHEDEHRAELDRRLLTEVLGLPASLCAGEDSPLALLRRKLAAEPSIHGGKKSKVVL